MANAPQRAKAARLASRSAAASASTRPTTSVDVPIDGPVDLPLSQGPISSPGRLSTSPGSLPPELGAAVPRLEPTLPEGTRLGAFEIKGVIAQSRAAVVYRAADLSLGVPAAIKEYMPLGFARRGRNYHVESIEAWHEDTIDLGRRAFFAESRALARCDDPALLRVTQLWEVNGTVYRVMPLYSGKRLVDLRRDMKGPIDEVALRALMHRLLDALAAYHASGGAHGNITPMNILMPALDRPLLLGPGKTGALLATDLGEPVRNEFEATFAAPEQLEPQASFGISADLYSLAQTLRYAVTGAAPIASESLRSAVLRLLGASAVSGFSDALLDVLTSATSGAPSERPQSVEEFRLRLRRLDQQSAVLTLPPPAAAVAAPAARPPMALPVPSAPASQHVAAAAGSAAVSSAAPLAVASPAPMVAAASGSSKAASTHSSSQPAEAPDEERTVMWSRKPAGADEEADETIDVSSLLGDLPRGGEHTWNTDPASEPASTLAAPDAQSEAHASQAHASQETLIDASREQGFEHYRGEGDEQTRIEPRAESRLEPRLDFRLGDAIAPARITGDTASVDAAGAYSESAYGSHDAHAYRSFEASRFGDGLGANAGMQPRKRAWWSSPTVQITGFVVALSAIAVAVILAVSGVWDPRGPQIDLPRTSSDLQLKQPPADPDAAPAAAAVLPALPTPSPSLGASAGLPVLSGAGLPADDLTAPAAAPPVTPVPVRRDDRPARKSTATGSSTSEAATNPRDPCAGRTQQAYQRCIQAQCTRPRWASHPECTKLRHSEVGGSSGD